MAKPQIENGYTMLANEIVDAFTRLHLSGNEWRVLWVVIRKTYGFHKKIDRIVNSQICNDTMLGKTVVSRALKHLQTVGVITRNGSTIGLQKDYEGWLRPFETPVKTEPKYKRRIITGDGYVALWYGTVEPEFRSMANRTGYIYEHRLVMARKLGRCLEPWEIVHHKDGTRDHNSDDNLVLLPGRPEHMPSIKARQEIKKLKELSAFLISAMGEEKLAELIPNVSNLSEEKVSDRLSTLAKSSLTLAKSSTKVSSPAVTQKKKDTLQKKGSPKGDHRIKEILDTIEQNLGQQIPFYAKEGAAVKRALNMGFTPEEILGCWEMMRGFEFWQGKWLPLAKVTENLGEYKSGRLRDGSGAKKTRRVAGGRTASEHERGF